MRLLKSLFESLGFQLLLALSVVLAVVLTAHAFIAFRATQSQITHLIEAETRRTSDLVRRATHDGMLLNQLDEVQQTLERMGEGPDVLALRVFDKDGRIVMSSLPAEIGRQSGMSDEACAGCHVPRDALQPAVSEETETIRRSGEPDSLRHLSVIENEPACSNAACHAHPPDQKVLGVLDLEMSLAPAESALASARRQLIITSIVLLLLTGVVTWWFVNRLVHRPASKLRRAAMRVSVGDLDVRTSVRGRHELARLSQTFNSMIADLAEARREVQDWSQRLEAKVVEKTDELQRSQRQVLHMEKMASLGKLAATVAHELNNPLGGILTYARLVRREIDDLDSSEGLGEIRAHLVAIEQECARSGEIVRNLLLFAREGGAEKSPVDVSEVLERSIRLVRHHIEMYDLELEVTREIEGIRVYGNFGQLEQAV
ncbi:MAG: histidine kinase dimerization/phospho-acceptor domain-containing protein, partial [Thermoanaerobaculia bacterium]|nr:histidine kinase dimerization/phospho-acceptor domain-containing protein [Thermoanaerobaculia bacterium]